MPDTLLLPSHWRPLKAAVTCSLCSLLNDFSKPKSFFSGPLLLHFLLVSHACFCDTLLKVDCISGACTIHLRLVHAFNQKHMGWHGPYIHSREKLAKDIPKGSHWTECQTSYPSSGSRRFQCSHCWYQTHANTHSSQLSWIHCHFAHFPASPCFLICPLSVPFLFINFPVSRPSSSPEDKRWWRISITLH